MEAQRKRSFYITRSPGVYGYRFNHAPAAMKTITHLVKIVCTLGNVLSIVEKNHAWPLDVRFSSNVIIRLDVSRLSSINRGLGAPAHTTYAVAVLAELRCSAECPLVIRILGLCSLGKRQQVTIHLSAELNRRSGAVEVFLLVGHLPERTA